MHVGFREVQGAKRRVLSSGLFGALALILAVGVLVYFTRPKPPEHGKASAGAPVRIGKVERRSMAVIERSAGSVMAETFVQVFPLVTGEIKQQGFREGQFVNKGDLLFQIDPDPYRAAVDQARGTYEKDRALLRNAKLDQQRFETLYKQDSTSQQARDTAIASADVLAATVVADKAALDTAQLNLGYTQIRAPITGKTGPVLVQPGNIVIGTSQVTALVTIAQVKPIKISFNLPQSDLPRVQRQQREGKLIARIENLDLAAPVDFVGNAVNAQSGTIELRATFKNEDLALVPGQLVQVVVELGELPDALVLPRDAVNDSPGGSYVFAVEQNKAVVKPVDVLFDDGAKAAVVGALNPGDVVITEGQLRVDAGGAVNVLGESIPPPKMASDKIHPAK